MKTFSLRIPVAVLQHNPDGSVQPAAQSALDFKAQVPDDTNPETLVQAFTAQLSAACSFAAMLAGAPPGGPVPEEPRNLAQMDTAEGNKAE